jgi:hypothetical protein
MRKKQPPPLPEKEVSIDQNGRRFTGHYTTKSGMVTVRYLGQSKTTQIGGAQVEHIAQVLLSELATRGGPDLPAFDVAQAEAAAASIISAQPRGREVPRGELEQKLRREGHSPGAIFEALNRIERKR